MFLYFLFGCAFGLIFIRLLRISLINALIGGLLFAPFSGVLCNLGGGITVPRLFLIPFLAVFIFGIIKVLVEKRSLGNKLVFILVWFVFATLTVFKGALLAERANHNLIVPFIKYGYFIAGAGIILFDQDVDISSLYLPLMAGGLCLVIVGMLQFFLPAVALKIGIGPMSHFDRILPFGIRISGRINALHGNPNAVAIYYGIAALAFAWYTLQKPGIFRFGCILGLLLCIGCLILSFSRAGYISFAFCVALLLLLQPSHQRKNWKISLITIFVVFVMTLVLFSARKFGGTSDITRIGLWASALKVVSTSSMELLFGNFAIKRMNAHSGPLQILYDYGILGLVIYLSLLCLAFTRCIQRLKINTSHTLLFCIVLYFVCIDLVHSSAVSSIVFWIYLAGTQLTFSTPAEL